jgi:hypothetical protein
MVMGGTSNLVFSALILNAENKFKEFKYLEGKDTG